MLKRSRNFKCGYGRGETYRETETHIDRETETHIDRETETHIDRETETHIDRETETHIDRETERYILFAASVWQPPRCISFFA